MRRPVRGAHRISSILLPRSFPSAIPENPRDDHRHDFGVTRMWMLDNKTPYAAERTWTRDKNGAHHWLVAVKATFDIGADGRVPLAPEQAPPLLAPEYWGDLAKSALRLDGDLLAAKPGTDVLLEANAHAPVGRPAESVPVSLRVGPVNKTV